MIAAYIPGYSVTPQYLAANPHLRFGQGSRDTNVLLSWNTEAPTIGAPNPVLLPGAMAINPITWTRSGRVASASSSRGSWLPDATGVFTRVRHYDDARREEEGRGGRVDPGRNRVGTWWTEPVP